MVIHTHDQIKRVDVVADKLSKRLSEFIKFFQSVLDVAWSLVIKNTCRIVKDSDMGIIEVVMSQNNVDVASLEHVELAIAHQFWDDAVILEESVFILKNTFLLKRRLPSLTLIWYSPKCGIHRGFNAPDCIHFSGKMALQSPCTHPPSFEPFSSTFAELPNHTSCPPNLSPTNNSASSYWQSHKLPDWSESRRWSASFTSFQKT